ncbi:MAG: hypothetical protein ACETV1_00195 [Candidatus Bathyarchaeia archaeon]
MGENQEETPQAETPQAETHKNGKTRVDIFRLIGYKGDAKRRGYWSSVRILLRNYRKYKGSQMEIFENGKWQSLTVKRAEEMAKIEEAAIAHRKTEKEAEKKAKEAEKNAKAEATTETTESQ